MQDDKEFLTRAQTRMHCGVCNTDTDTKCVACGMGICEDCVSLRMKEGYYCRSCHDIKVRAMKEKLKNKTENKERITSIKQTGKPIEYFPENKIKSIDTNEKI